MGSTSAQGWYLFAFILGFTLGPAGMFALGWPVALIGFALTIVAFAGFHSIKEPVMTGREGTRPASAAAPAFKATSASSF
jgi:hypothetical protein